MQPLGLTFGKKDRRVGILSIQGVLLDLIFTIAGLMLARSLTSYLRREHRVLNQLAEKKPKDIFSLVVPYNQRQVLSELNHFAKRNHLNSFHLNSTTHETWVLQSDKTPDLRFPVYVRQLNPNKSVLEIGAASISGSPYIMIRRKHRDAAVAIGAHLKSSWLRSMHFTIVANSEVKRVYGVEHNAEASKP